MPSTSLVLWKQISVFQPKASCGCPIWVISYLGGQHPWQCRNILNNNGDTRSFKLVGDLQPHQVDGVVMPWASVGGVDMSTRWCDFSELGDGQRLGRRFDSTHHFAMASRTKDGTWHWAIFYTGRPDGHPVPLASGDADKVVEVMESVCFCETELELAA